MSKTNAAKNDKTTRQRYRRRLESWGMGPEVIAECLNEIRENQQAKRRGELPMDAPLCSHPEYLAYRNQHLNRR